MKPAIDEYASPYAGYVDLVDEDDIVAVLEKQNSERNALLFSIPEERGGHRYAEGKWSIRQIVGHLIDGERVFGYRALCISRSDPAQLPPFDEDIYVANATFENRSLSDLIGELDECRRANVRMFRAMTEEQWSRRGVANQNAVTVRALAYIIAGHERHHLRVLRERYLTPDIPLKQTKSGNVTGVGGIFFKSPDADRLRKWYAENLGIQVEDWGGTVFNWREMSRPDQTGYTVWSVFPSSSKYFDPSSSQFMVNFRVDDLDATLAALRGRGVSVDEKTDSSDFGKFGWFIDADGNRVELWEPPREQ